MPERRLHFLLLQLPEQLCGKGTTGSRSLLAALVSCLSLGLGVGRVTPREGAACCMSLSSSALLAEDELAALQGQGQCGTERVVLTTSFCSSCSLCSLRRWTQTCKVPSSTPCRLW